MTQWRCRIRKPIDVAWANNEREAKRIAAENAAELSTKHIECEPHGTRNL